jgi:hypothetical protein
MNNGIGRAQRNAVSANVAAIFVGLDDNLIFLLTKAASAPKHADAALIALVIINRNPVHYNIPPQKEFM